MSLGIPSEISLETPYMFKYFSRISIMDFFNDSSMYFYGNTYNKSFENHSDIHVATLTSIHFQKAVIFPPEIFLHGFTRCTKNNWINCWWNPWTIILRNPWKSSWRFRGDFFENLLEGLLDKVAWNNIWSNFWSYLEEFQTKSSKYL